MNLNDDCLILIFRLLELRDQISTAQACQQSHAVLCSLWQRTYTEFSMDKDEINTCEDLAVFLECICSTVQKMDLGRLHYKEWNIIKLYSYPNVHCLSLNNSHNASDEFVLKMTEIFPNLRSFSPNWLDISGRHIERWRYLEDLDLSNCENIKFNQFEKILEELRLKSVALGGFCDNSTWTSALAFERFCELERIAVCEKEVILLTHLSLFLNLKVLEFLDLKTMNSISGIIRYVVHHRHNDLVELCAGVDFPLNKLLVCTFRSLRKLHIGWRDTYNFVQIFDYAPNLREIVLKECYGLKEEDIYRCLYATQIEFLSVENCACRFRELRLNVNDIVRHRTIPMHFHFHLNIDTVKLSVQGESPLLKITSKSVGPPTWACTGRLRFL